MSFFSHGRKYRRFQFLKLLNGKKAVDFRREPFLVLVLDFAKSENLQYKFCVYLYVDFVSKMKNFMQAQISSTPIARGHSKQGILSVRRNKRADVLRAFDDLIDRVIPKSICAGFD